MPGFLWPALDANIPLAAGYLTSWARGPAGLKGWELEILPWGEADVLGDEALLRSIRSRDPDVVGFSLYLWNAERSLGLAQTLSLSGITVLVGGPEALPDNAWLWKRGGFSAAVGGEGEEAFSRVLEALGRGADWGAVPGVLPPPASAGRWPASCPADLSRLPSPYLTGTLSPYPDGSVWLETVRGCPFRCAYCHYGKTRGKPQPFPSIWLERHLRWAQEQGAREIYLMDPSFNVRPDWDRVLRVLESSGAAKSLRLHTELVADGLRPGDGTRLARAGLASCEVGLQSIDPEVLARVGRTWNPDPWVRGVRELAAAGVKVTVGLIAGLPGDTLAGFSRSLDFVRKEAPEAEVQVFPLALLPGTELRGQSGRFGVRALDVPPYTVLETSGFTTDDLAACFDRFEETLGLELDPLGNPALTGPWSGGGEAAPYLSGVLLDAPRAGSGWVDKVAPRACRNLTLWVRGWSDGIPAEVARLAARLPHGVLTIVLEDRPGWPPNRLVELLSAAGTGDHYLDRYFRLLYGQGSRAVPRLVALVEDGERSVSGSWIHQIEARADVVWALDAAPGWLDRALARAGGGHAVYVRGEVDGPELNALSEELGNDASALIFESGRAQERWNQTLGVSGFRAAEFRAVLP